MDLYTIRNQLMKGKTIYDLPLRVTFYARVSTEKDSQTNSLDNQLNHYPRFIKEQTNWTYVEGYWDEGISGTKIKKREDFLRMLDEAKEDKFDFILTKEISRFARNTIDSIQSTKTLMENGVGVLFESDNINTLMPDSELRLSIMSAIAQDEVRKISERVKFGFKRAVENGRVLGSSNIWGYDKDDGKLVINEKQAEMIRLIFDWYANERCGMRTIVNRLSDKGYFNKKGNPFSLHTIRYIITNPKYKGYYCGNRTSKIDYMMDDVKYKDKSEWIMYKDEENVPPIIEEALWEKANRLYNQRSDKLTLNNTTGYTNKYSYSGKIWCAEHNVLFYRSEYRYKSGNKETWQCKYFKEKGKDVCDSPTLYTTELNEIVKQAYESLVLNKADVIQEMTQSYGEIYKTVNVDKEINILNKKINEVLLRKDKILDLNINGVISNEEFKSRNDNFNNEITQIRNNIQELEEQKNKNKSYEESIKILRESIATRINYEFDEKCTQGVIDDILDKIIVYKTDDKNIVNLKIYFKALNIEEDYEIKKQKGKKSIITKLPFDTHNTYRLYQTEVTETFKNQHCVLVDNSKFKLIRGLDTNNKRYSDYFYFVEVYFVA